MISRAVMLGCLVYTIPDGLLYRQEKYSGLIREKNRYSHCYKEWHSNLSDMWQFTFEIGAAQSSFVTEMCKKSSIGYGFGAGPRAIPYSIDITSVHWDKRTWLRKKRMQSHRVDTILPPFYVFGTTIWPTCRHVNNHKLFLRLTAIKT